MSGAWKQVDGWVRCSECGRLNERSWRWFVKNTWTLALCLACVDDAENGWTEERWNEK